MTCNLQIMKRKYVNNATKNKVLFYSIVDTSKVRSYKII